MAEARYGATSPKSMCRDGVAQARSSASSARRRELSSVPSTARIVQDMKTEFIDVSDTKKNLVVEIPSTVVDAEIDKVSRDYSNAARIPGFRPGKVPAKVVRQRFRDQILHDVAHGLIPRAVDDALRERESSRSTHRTSATSSSKRVSR